MTPVRVKRCGKSAPRTWQHGRHGKPHLEQGQIGKSPEKGSGCPPVLPGRPLEVAGDGDPRGMIVLDRTRLTGRLHFPRVIAFVGTTDPARGVLRHAL